jgi:transposase
MAAIITEHQGHGRTCPCCGRITRAAIPQSVRAHVIGPRLAAAMSYLAGRCHDGRRTVQEIMRDLFDVPLALGTVSHYERQTSEALQPACRQALEHVKLAAGRNVDETGWSQAGQGCWLWTAATKQAACFLIHGKRNSLVLKQFLGDPLDGITTSDRHGLYGVLPLTQRQLCWAHLKRDFQKWLDKGQDTRQLGGDGLAICKQVFALWRRFRKGRLGAEGLRRRAGPLRRRLGQVLAWQMRCCDKKAAEFCRRLRRVQKALWTFVHHPRCAEPTNNHAERMLRMAVLWRKNSFGCHSDAGCRFVERMLTVVQSLRLQGRGVMQFLHQSIQAHRHGLPAPSLIV